MAVFPLTNINALSEHIDMREARILVGLAEVESEFDLCLGNSYFLRPISRIIKQYFTNSDNSGNISNHILCTEHVTRGLQISTRDKVYRINI